MADDNKSILIHLVLSEESDLDLITSQFDCYTRDDVYDNIIIDISFMTEDEPSLLSNLSTITGYSTDTLNGVDFVNFYV